MLTADQDNCGIAFPAVPADLREKYAIHVLALRPFGVRAEDLEIDFRQPHRPLLVTQLLLCCTVANGSGMPGVDFFWDLTIGKRIQALLTIVAADRELPLRLPLQCANLACQEPLEIEISLGDLTELQARADSSTSIVLADGDAKIGLRLPAGRDQMAWLSHTYPNENAAARAMMQTLYTDDFVNTPGSVPLSDEWVSVMDEAMEEADPLINFSLEVHCPACHSDDRCAFNLEAWALQRLYQNQQTLLRTAHRLASRYHWSEAQIFALPAWRRTQYLELIEKEEGR